RLQTQSTWPIDGFEQLGHPLPAVHTAPADLAFGREPLSEAFRDGACFAEGLRNAACISGRILRPFRRTARGIDPYNSIIPDSDVPQLSCNGTGFPNL